MFVEPEQCVRRTGLVETTQVMIFSAIWFAILVVKMHAWEKMWHTWKRGFCGRNVDANRRCTDCMWSMQEVFASEINKPALIEADVKPCIHKHAAYVLHCLCAHVRGARLINFPQIWGEQRTPGTWKGHLVHPVSSLCVCAKNQQISVHGEWYANHSRIAQRRFAVSSTHMRIWFFAKHLVGSCIRGLRDVDVDSWGAATTFECTKPARTELL